MYEKRLKAVPPQLLTSNGTSRGKVTVADTSPFKVKQEVVLTAATLPTLILEVKRIEDDKVTMYLGPKGQAIYVYADLALYTTLQISAIHAEEQRRSIVPEQEIPRIVYSEDPTCAIRTILVDPWGNRISSVNPLPVTFPATSKTNPIIVNLSLVVSGNEYSATLPQNARSFLVKTKNSSRFAMAYTAGGTAATPLTVGAGSFYSEDGLVLSAPLPLYFSSVKANETIEIVYWTS